MYSQVENRRDILLIVFTMFISFVISAKLDLFEKLIAFSEKYEDYEIDEIIIVIIITGFSSILLVIKKFFQINRLNKKLEILNRNLENKVNNQVKKQRQNEQILIEQSKNAAMGEMIGHIAHQWRQPLNALGLILQNIKFSYEMDELTDDFMNKSIHKANLLTNSMSKTIDDFRNFFKPNKLKEKFIVDEIVNKSVSIIESTLKNSNIELILKQESNLNTYGYANELSQVILNILNNAKDAIEENNVLNPLITIRTYKKENFIILKISDNAKGIPDNILNRIFDPYFTTKEEGKGTGIGLYMSKIIIEQNMNGKIKVHNIDNGAEFIIKIPVSYKKENS